MKQKLIPWSEDEEEEEEKQKIRGGSRRGRKMRRWKR